MAKPKKKAAKKAKKKTSKSSGNSRIAAIKRLAKRPMKELTRGASLLSEAIDLKSRLEFERKGLFFGPKPPTAAEREWMAKESELRKKAKKIANLEKARLARLQKKMVGPRWDPYEQAAGNLTAGLHNI